MHLSRKLFSLKATLNPPYTKKPPFSPTLQRRCLLFQPPPGQAPPVSHESGDPSPLGNVAPGTGLPGRLSRATLANCNPGLKASSVQSNSNLTQDQRLMHNYMKAFNLTEKERSIYLFICLVLPLWKEKSAPQPSNSTLKRKHPLSPELLCSLADASAFSAVSLVALRLHLPSQGTLTQPWAETLPHRALPRARGSLWSPGLPSGSASG